VPGAGSEDEPRRQARPEADPAARGFPCSPSAAGRHGPSNAPCAPTDTRYAVQLQVPGEVGQVALIPRRVVERALVDPVSLGRVRSLLRAAADALRSQRPQGPSRLVTGDPGPGGSPERAPCCARCQARLLTDDPVVVQGGARRHLACPTGGLSELEEE
jgi:hypothetical protein